MADRPDTLQTNIATGFSELSHRPEVIGVIFGPQKRLQVSDVSQSGAHADDLSRLWQKKKTTDMFIH